jgi:hypothetical protein
MFSLNIYVVFFVIMTLRYILTNIDYTFVSFLRSFNHILNNVDCDLHEWISLNFIRIDIKLWCKFFVSAQRWYEVIIFISLYNINPIILNFIWGCLCFVSLFLIFLLWTTYYVWWVMNYAYNFSWGVEFYEHIYNILMN